ncbi:Hypothetical predicted protein [Octopus vulgaris]|uniref:Uncharacterized protein n=1 Tax=Octopus vulgaris TaxID=6645 RepID=A0AA36BBD5_OCTVU|nr:Hypothetical predicted protein [Octopus vulgaris]
MYGFLRETSRSPNSLRRCFMIDTRMEVYAKKMRIKDADFDGDGDVVDDGNGKEMVIVGDYLYSWSTVHMAELKRKLE